MGKILFTIDTFAAEEDVDEFVHRIEGASTTCGLSSLAFYGFITEGFDVTKSDREAFDDDGDPADVTDVYISFECTATGNDDLVQANLLEALGDMTTLLV